jgi:hypothetical protein
VGRAAGWRARPVAVQGGGGAVQKPFTQDPWQHALVPEHAPPIGTHDWPPCTQTPFWQTPGGQQSESAVHTEPPMGRQLAAQVKPLRPGRQMWEQQLSQSEQAWPVG